MNTHVIDVAIPARDVADIIDDTLDAVLSQRLPAGWSMHVYVADDGSYDAIDKRIATRQDPRISLLRHEDNRGRSAACNTAIRAGHGDIVVVVDADCRYADDMAFDRMLRHFGNGADSVLGAVTAEGTDFWPWFARDVSHARLSRARARGAWHMTTANFAIRRMVMTMLGGFSERYHRYGFEDRDLLVRLARSGAVIVIDEQIAALHREPTSVDEVCRKLFVSGRYSARLFAAHFPEEYRDSSYHHIDIAKHPAFARLLRPLLNVAAPFTVLIAALLIRRRWLGFSVQAFALRVASAVSYMHGCATAAADDVFER